MILNLAKNKKDKKKKKKKKWVSLSYLIGERERGGDRHSLSSFLPLIGGRKVPPPSHLLSSSPEQRKRERREAELAH